MLPAVGRAQALDHLDGRALARAVGSEHAEDFSRLDLEGHAVHRAQRAVGFDEIDDFDGGGDMSGVGGARGSPDCAWSIRRAQVSRGKATVPPDGHR